MRSGNPKWLAACPHCRAQYDLTGRSELRQFHCRCGTLVKVQAPVLHDARIVRCASCGGVRGQKADNCDFCGARFSAVDKGWGSMCPHCFCRLPSDAGYCVECGLKISPEAFNSATTDFKCPRCDYQLQSRLFDQIQLLECASCAGVWLASETFEEICKQREKLGMAARGLASKRRDRKRFELTQSESVKYIPCPVCKNLMNRKNFARVSGVIIDVCKDHGVWLDNQELGRIVQFIEADGLEKARAYEANEKRHSEAMRKMNVPDHFRPMAAPQSSPDGGVMLDVVSELARLFLKGM